ncbi:DUF397 domain-containing protein [Actinomadura flavalba]|uniref:DUF397 domain-containing protein n=1 Tax=Actinomadura flavalba TaxID=1120938 RepID=UPI0003663B1E|nr:DUF397 domain-containing protein [Actinomadura flavalba]
MNLSNATWRKATHSHPQDDCIELASVSGTVAIRDTKDRDGDMVLVSRADFRRFSGVVKAL